MTSTLSFIRPSFSLNSDPDLAYVRTKLRKSYLNRHVRMQVIVHAYNSSVASRGSIFKYGSVCVGFNNDMFRNVDGNNAAFGNLFTGASSTDILNSPDREMKMSLFYEDVVGATFLPTNPGSTISVRVGNHEHAYTLVYDLGVVEEIYPNFEMSVTFFNANGAAINNQAQAEVILELV